MCQQEQQGGTYSVRRSSNSYRSEDEDRCFAALVKISREGHKVTRQVRKVIRRKRKNLGVLCVKLGALRVKPEQCDPSRESLVVLNVKPEQYATLHT